MRVRVRVRVRVRARARARVAERIRVWGVDGDELLHYAAAPPR